MGCVPCVIVFRGDEEAQVDETAELTAAGDEVLRRDVGDGSDSEADFREVMRFKGGAGGAAGSGGGGGKPNEGGEGESGKQEGITAKVDPLLWKLELERVAPKLKRIQAASVGADASLQDWRQHLEETHLQLDAVQKVIWR